MGWSPSRTSLEQGLNLIIFPDLSTARWADAVPSTGQARKPETLSSQEATRTTPAGGGQLSPHPSPPWGVLGPGKQEEDTALSKVLTQVLAVPAPGKRLQQALWG